MPHACIAADVIVGFPDETEEDFLTTHRYIESLDISYLHVFTYSERVNTKAALMQKKVPHTFRKERSVNLHKLSDVKKKVFYSKNEGRTVDVLFESNHHDGFIYGFSENYIRVKTAFDPRLVNKITTVTLSGLDHEGNYIYE